MDLLSIIFIAIGLAMDCFAVSVTKGICLNKFYFRETLKMAFLFGLFQGGMPLIGYFVGINFADTISHLDHWIAFVLLAFIGGKMILEGINNEKNQKKTDECDPLPPKDQFRWNHILILALATSIDALATGIIIVPFPLYLLSAITIISIVSFVFTFGGMLTGIHFGSRFKINANILGGSILILIGIKILTEHLFFI